MNVARVWGATCSCCLLSPAGRWPCRSFASEFAVSMALTCLMYVALSSSWALFCGTTRYLSWPQSAFFGIGAYTSALSLEHLPWVQAIAWVRLIAVAVAVVMGAAVLHLRGTYFRSAHLRHDRAHPPRHHLLGKSRSPARSGGCWWWCPSATRSTSPCCCWPCWPWRCRSFVRRTRFGLALIGIGADEQRAQTLGVNTKAHQDAGLCPHRCGCGRGGRGHERALDLHRPTHRLQPLHRLSDRADRPDRRSMPPCGAR
jgi:hypothetical protein